MLYKNLQMATLRAMYRMYSRNDTYSNLICAPGKYSELRKVRKFVSTKAELFGFGADEANQIALAVDEACTNLIQHAYHLDKSKQFCVEVETSGRRFVVKILDDGEPFNPLDVNSPNMKKYLKEFRKGGLGIHLMKLVMDDIKYSPSSKSRPQNVLKLIKLLQ